MQQQKFQQLTRTTRAQWPEKGKEEDRVRLDSFYVYFFSKVRVHYRLTIGMIIGGRHVVLNQDSLLIHVEPFPESLTEDVVNAVLIWMFQVRIVQSASIHPLFIYFPLSWKRRSSRAGSNFSSLSVRGWIKEAIFESECFLFKATNQEGFRSNFPRSSESKSY